MSDDRPRYRIVGMSLGHYGRLRTKRVFLPRTWLARIRGGKWRGAGWARTKRWEIQRRLLRETEES